MTVKELKRYLDDVPDTAIVVIRNHTAPTILEKHGPDISLLSQNRMAGMYQKP